MPTTWRPENNSRFDLRPLDVRRCGAFKSTLTWLQRSGTCDETEQARRLCEVAIRLESCLPLREEAASNTMPESR